MFCYSRECHTSQADYHCVPRNEKGRKEGHLLLCSPINPMLPEGDDRRQKSVTSCVSQDSFVFPSPYVLIMELPPDSMCLRWLKIISHHKKADKKHHLLLYFHCWSLHYNKEIVYSENSTQNTHMTFRDADFYCLATDQLKLVCDCF